MKRVAIYSRTSTTEQNTDNQVRELKQIAERQGWAIVAEFSDHGVSGAKGRDKRPQFDAMCRAAVRRDFDLIMAWSVDRLGRSLQHLLQFLEELHAIDVDLYLYQQGLNTSTPAGKALFQMCGVFAEFERAMIRERVNAGLARAKEKGTKSGKPIGRPKALRPVQVIRIREARANGQSLRSIAKQFKTSLGSVQRALVEAT